MCRLKAVVTIALKLFRVELEVEVEVENASFRALNDDHFIFIMIWSMKILHLFYILPSPLLLLFFLTVLFSSNL